MRVPIVRHRYLSMFDEREVRLENSLEVKAWDAETKVVENFDAMI